MVPLGGDLNTITPLVFHNLFPAWSAGVAYATLAVAALIPAAVTSISAANLFTRSIWIEYVRPRASAAQEARVGRWTSLLLKFCAAGFILLINPAFSAEMQLIGGVLILQTLPAVFFGLMTGWLHRYALITGMVVGLGFGLLMLYKTPAMSPDLSSVVKAHFGGSSYALSHFGLSTTATVYAGLLALLANLLIVVVGTVMLRLIGVPAGVDVTRKVDYEADTDDPSLDRLDYLLDGMPEKSGAHALR